MESNKIRVLLTAVKAGSLHKAAEELDYTQPTLTAMMRSLEKELGIQILNRGSSGVRLTKAGELLLPYMKEFLEAEKNLQDKASEYSGTALLRVGSLPSISSMIMPAVLKRMQAEFPGTEIMLTIGTGSLGNMLKAGKLDLIIDDLARAGDEETEVLMEDEMVAAVSEDMYRCRTMVPMEELLEHRVLFSSADKNSAPMKALGDFSHYRLFEINDDMSTRIQMVAQGLGISFLSAMYSKAGFRNVRLVSVNPPIRRTLAVCTRMKEKSGKTAKDFIRVFKEELKKAGYDREDPGKRRGGA